MTTTFDATPFTTVPAGISALPTGVYQLPITAPSIAPASCLSDSTQSEAWSCAIQPTLPYQISIFNIPGSDGLSGNSIKLDYGNHTVDYLPYGAQPPIFNLPREMRLVNDSTFPERGPAWFFQTPYDKIVVLPESKLIPPAVKRDGSYRSGESTSGFMNRKGVAQPGDMPWICYWNATLLEAFIYVDQTSISANLQAAASSKTSGSSASSTYSSGVPTFSTPPFGNPSYGLPGDPDFLSCYPKMLKLEERRVMIAGQVPPPPYCIQHIIDEDGTYSPNMDGNLPVTVYLNETIPSFTGPMSGKRVSFGSIKERDDGLLDREVNTNVCGCVWLES